MKICFYCFSLFIALTSFSINKEELDGLYARSILHHLDKIENDTIYVFQDSEIEVPTKVGKFYLISIDENNIKNILEEKKTFYAIKLFPIETKKKKIQIRIVDFYIEYADKTKNNIAFINTGVEVFTFKLKKGHYKLIKTEQLD